MLEPVYNKILDAKLVYSNQSKIRFESTAGGYITSLIKYLFEIKFIESTITFDRSGITFEPKIIYSFSEYNNYGSIYQEIELFKFLKNNKKNIKGRILITCLPCQVNSIKSFMKKNSIEVFVVSLVCSAQMSKKCTETYLKYMNVNEPEIKDFRYRGRGWPKYIQIKTDQRNIEEKELWNYMFHSFIFTEKRCFKCTDTFGVKSDIAVSDPWLGKMMKNEKLGKSILFYFSKKHLEILKRFEESNLIKTADIDNHIAINSQLTTMKKKNFIRNSPKILFLLKFIKREKITKIIISNKQLLILYSRIINKIIVKLSLKD